MSYANLSLSNFIQVSIAPAGAGITQPSSSNVLMLTRDSSSNTTNNALGWGAYLASAAVGTDFGSSSTTALMAAELFAQTPNILAGGGQLIIAPYLTSSQVAVQSIEYLSLVSTCTADSTYASGATTMTLTNAGVTNITNITEGQYISGINLAPNTIVTGITIGATTSTVSFTPAAQGAGTSATVYFCGTPGTPTAGAYVLTYNVTASSSIAYNATAATIQGDLRTASSISGLTVAGSPAGIMTITYTGLSGAVPHNFYVTTNTLTDVNSNVLIPFIFQTTPGATGETLDQAIQRLAPIVNFFGVLPAEISGVNAVLPAATSQILQAAGIQAQSLNKLLFVVGNNTNATTGDLAQFGPFYSIMDSGLTNTRCLYYGDPTVGGTGNLAPINALYFAAGYVGRGLSVDFEGNNTTLTMNLKSIAGISPDPSTSQTLLNLAIAAGVDTYFSYAGIGKVYSTGANNYFDNVYNALAFVGALQVDGFDALAQQSTKLPQTNQGINALVNGYKLGCQEFVNNGFIAPGVWTGETFGNPTLLYSNVANVGFYIFAPPISQQSPTALALRQAPLIQIAANVAGALQSSSVLISFQNY